MTRHSTPLTVRLLILAFLACFYATARPELARGQCFVPRNAAEIELGIRKLNVLGSVLYIAAHPDDENSALLAYLGQGQLFRTAYLAINRGEGGQNLIGREKGVDLGIIRTAELLAARRVDGAEQMFTRAYDFGYSKTVNETLSQWDREAVLGDIVWAIRRFQPDIIVTRFPVTGEGKHGHHTASGVLTEEAFSAAADPNRYPEQLKAVRPWQTRTLLLNNMPAKWDPKFTEAGKIAVDIGAFNRVLGKSYGEISAESRNNHKSQGFGTAADSGPRLEYFTLRNGSDPGPAPFDQANYLLSKHAGTGKLQKAIRQLQEDFAANESSEDLTEDLLRVRSSIQEIPEAVWLSQKLAEVDRLLLDISGMRLEATAELATVSPGEQLAYTLKAIRRNDTHLALCGAKANWSKELKAPPLRTNEWASLTGSVQVPGDAPLSNQYWLEQAFTGRSYQIADDRQVGPAFSPGQLQASFSFCYDSKPAQETISWSCPLSYRSLSQKDGDQYEEVSVVPAVTLSLGVGSAFVPRQTSYTLQIAARSTTPGTSGTIELKAPKGWALNPTSFPVNFPEAGHPLQHSVIVTPSGSAADGKLRATFVAPSGVRSSWSRYRIEYPHIEPHSYLQAAELKLTTGSIITPKLNIGYVMGAGDDVLQSLQLLGYSPQLLSDRMLLQGDLKKLDTIVVGVRALNTRREWKNFFPRLMEFVERGGTLVLQYSANDSFSKVPETFAPYPFKLTSIRVTDENAEVSLVDSESELLRRPNRITAADFAAWVQERGLWFAGDFDSKYRAPLSMHDPGEAPQSGALIASKFGKGHFIYTGLAFFRQLPAGNAGAYRLFVNLLSYGHNKR